VVGSANLSDRSMALDTECDLPPFADVVVGAVGVARGPEIGANAVPARAR
jgi:hypothetical protein